MPIGGNNDTFTITGAKLKVDQGVEVGGSVAYTTDATGFGGVSAQIDNNNTLNITSGKLAGVAKIERNTAATITAITHTNVNNNTTIHLALKNTSTDKGVFITLGTFASDDTVKVNYTDNYLIGPGETGMITLRKVNGVLSLFVREMFTSKATSFDNTDNSPFYIKDGVNYKYPLYKFVGTGLTSEVIQGTTYYKPSAGITTQTRPPKGIPENVTPPSASSFNIGNNSDLTSVEYSVLGVSSNYDYASVTDSNNVTQARFILTDGEASGSFTESGASSGDSYKLYIEKTDTTLTDTVAVVSATPTSPFAVFHHGTFANSEDPYSHGSVTAAATAGYFYSDTPTGTYTLGTLDETPIFVQETAAGGDKSGKTTYKFTFLDLSAVDVLMVAGGGGGGGDIGGGGGAGGYIETKNTTISAGQKTIIVGGGGIGGSYTSTSSYRSRGRNGSDTSVSGFTTVIGGGGGATGHNNGDDKDAGDGGSGGGGSGGRQSSGAYGAPNGTGTAGQGFDGADSGSTWYPGGGGGAGEKGYGYNGSGGGGTSVRGDGGNGKQSTITGFTSYWFAGGGGGCVHGSGQDGHGGKGGGGGGGGGSAPGNGDTNGLTNGKTGETGSGTHVDQQEPPTNREGGDGGKHTGGGGGAADHHYNRWGGNGGSGIAIIRTGGTLETGKKVPKLLSISNVTAIGSKTINYTFTKQGSGIDKVTYKIGTGSEVTTASGVYTLAYTPADFGTTTLTHAYAVDSSGNQKGTKFGPYSVLTKNSSLGHISAPILTFFSMGTTVTDSINSVAFTTDSGSFTYDTTNNAITNSGSARMKLDFTSVRTDRNTAISAFYEFYLPSGTQYQYAASLGGVHDGTGNNNDAIGWYGSTTPTTHYYANGTLALPTEYNYSNYYGKWVKLGWVRDANGNNFKIYVDGVLASTHTPDDGSLTGTGVLSYFYLFRHACAGNENSYTTDDAISFRNLEIYQASFTDEQILAAFGS